MMRVETNLQPSTIADVEAGKFVVLPEHNGFSFAIFEGLRDEFRTALVLNRASTEEKPAAVASEYRLAYTGRDDVFVVNDATLRPDLANIRFCHDGVWPIGALVHTVGGLGIIAAREAKSRGLVCFNLATGRIESGGSVSTSAPYYARWKIVVPAGPNEEVSIFEFRAAAD